MSKVRLMLNFDDLPDIVVEKKTYMNAESPKDAISVSRKGIFTFNSTLKKELIDSSESKNFWALIREGEGKLLIRIVSSDPKKDNAAKINKKTGIFSAKTILRNAKSIPKMRDHLVIFGDKDTKTVRFEKDGKHPILEVDSKSKTLILDTNTMVGDVN